MLVYVQCETATAMNRLSVLYSDGSGPCLVGLHEDTNLSVVARGEAE